MYKIIISIFFWSILFWCQNNTSRNIFNEANNFIEKPIESPFYGNKSSKVQLMIFSDFQCPACIRFEEAIWEKLEKDYINTNKIWVTYKNFPLEMHPNAPEDALWALCAHEQWKYLEFSKKIFTLEKDKAWLEVNNKERLEISKKIWLDTKKYEECVKNWNYVTKIKNDMAEGEKMWLQWTPSVYINWTLANMQKFDDVFLIIDNILK